MIYLDGNATTRPDPAVVEAVADCLRQSWGNPSSLHLAGQRARGIVEHSRRQVAHLIGAQPDEIVFTSGGTEADNQLLMGLPEAVPGRRHLVTTAIEHRAVLAPCERLEAAGWRVSRIPPGPDGRVDPAAVARACTADTALVSVMLANNETGVLQPVAEIARLAALRDRLHQLLAEGCPGLVVNGDGAPRLANTLNVSFPGVDAQALVMNLDLLGFCAATGSACAAAGGEPSHVLAAMGCAPERAAGALRLSLTRDNQPDDIEQLGRVLPALVARLKKS